MFKKKIRRSREWNKNNQLINFEKAHEVRRKNRDALLSGARFEKHRKKEGTTKREAVKKYRKINFYILVSLIVAVLAGISFFNIIAVNDQWADVVAEREDLENEKGKLTNELQNVESPEYIEQQARILKMIKPGEIYYIVPDEQE